MCVMSAGSMHRLTSSTTPKTVTGYSTSIIIYTSSICIYKAKSMVI